MKVAIAQQNYTVGDFSGNATKIVTAIQKAKNDKAKLIIFPEQALSGTPALGLLKSQEFLQKIYENLEEIAKNCEGITALIGLPIQVNGNTISAIAVVEDSRITRFVGKQHVEEINDIPYITNSKGSEYLLIDGRTVAVVVGEDMKYEKEYGETADMVVSCTKIGYRRGIIEERHNYFSRIAKTMKMPIVLVNHVGGNTGEIYDGGSAVYDNHGRSVALLKNFEEDFVVIDPFADNSEVEHRAKNKTANVYNAIKLGLRDYFVKNGFTKACLGLSGGVDSAVVAALCAETLGAENVRVLLMPSRFSSDHSVSDANELARNLGIQYDVVPISGMYEEALDTMATIFEGTEFSVAEENIQSRIRGLLLMSLSNKFGYILLNTTNKSESAVGYGTLYGDLNGSLSILGDLYKSEVFDLARYINRHHEIIPYNTIVKPPSAELRPDQKDSDSLPDYDLLDSILYRLIEKGQSVEEIAEAGYDETEVRRIATMLKNTEYKRYQLCPVIKLSACLLGVDRVRPLTSKF